jgi:hypothetical protein
MSLHDRILTEDKSPLQRGVKRLYIFDMDDTLVIHPERDEGEAEYREKTGQEWPHKEWWKVSKTLESPPFTIGPYKEIVNLYRKMKRDPDGKVVIMTGRIASPSMKKVTQKMLTKMGLGPLRHGDNLLLKNPNAPNTLSWKTRMLKGFTKRFPDLEEIHMWDDRRNHVASFEKTIRALGLTPYVHHVKKRSVSSLAADVSNLYDRVALTEVISAFAGAELARGARERAERKYGAEWMSRELDKMIAKRKAKESCREGGGRWFLGRCWGGKKEG